MWEKPRPSSMFFNTFSFVIDFSGTVDRASTSFSVMLIAHTQQCIILPLKAEGDPVNIEVDVLAKYVEASIGPRLEALESKVSDLKS